ncbi:hypothetical protein AXG93_2402s1030 [Marchantia polymorpha subsp. ruderalis]|uniref:Uncharacterized protein n=1 Tax=Marchantia polymorpha subsp. ruderalis TaxID=1480154 RepID=A0A176VV87_MARPO|nr:hypothetical protein AXG93_2402s1030 [Marchantia polymorpha subsp. ruderalis]
MATGTDRFSFYLAMEQFSVVSTFFLHASTGLPPEEPGVYCIRDDDRTDLKCPWIDESPPELGHFATLLKKICDTTNGAEVELIETGNIRGHYDPDCGKKIWFAVMRLELRWGDYTIILKDLTASGSWPHDVPFRQGMYLIKD